MFMADAIANCFAEAVTEARPAPADFKAFMFEPFEPEFVDLMRARMPDLDECKALGHIDAQAGGRPHRFAMPLPCGDAFWTKVGAALCSPVVSAAVKAKLGLEDAGVPRAAVLRDLPGYSIRVHPDSPSKIATVQVYLAANDSAPHMGLRFYRRYQGLHQLSGMCPYLPGRGYFFRRSADSLHGVGETTEKDGVRDSLMLIYFRSDRGAFI